MSWLRLSWWRRKSDEVQQLEKLLHDVIAADVKRYDEVVAERDAVLAELEQLRGLLLDAQTERDMAEAWAKDLQREAKS